MVWRLLSVQSRGCLMDLNLGNQKKNMKQLGLIWFYKIKKSNSMLMILLSLDTRRIMLLWRISKNKLSLGKLIKKKRMANMMLHTIWRSMRTRNCKIKLINSTGRKCFNRKGPAVLLLRRKELNQPPCLDPWWVNMRFTRVVVIYTPLWWLITI